MTDALRSMYQDVIIENAQHPRNYRALPDATYRREALNPLCGDQLTLFITVTDGTITDAAFTGSGCAISKASASLLTVAAKGLSVDGALELYERVHTMLTAFPEPDDAEPDVGALAALSGVHEYPARVKCASLAWQTLRSALTDDQTPVRTE
jgi:nitrogen fixation NifU-like protein